MKRIISCHNTSTENVALARRSQELDGGGSCPPQELPSSNITQTSQTVRYYPGHLKTSHSHTSKLSVDESSAESLRHHPGKPVIKARSIDELRSGGRSHSTLNITRMREASSEELDRRSSGSIQLSPRLRSSSFDLRMPPKDIEMKQGSLDKARNSRISKDQGDRRRSWALENFRPSLKRGETVDAAIVLDVPPELPPKTKPKRGLNTFNSNPENIGHLEGPIDLKVEQARMTKSGQPYLGNEQHAGMEAERKHSRHSSDPLLLLEEKTSCSLYQEAQNGKDPPVALPRKLLPPQTAFLEGRPEVPLVPSDHTHRDANGNKVTKSSSQSSLAHMPSTTNEGSGKGREPLGSFRQKSKARDPPLGNPSSTPELMSKNDNTSAPSQKCRPDSPKTHTVKSKFTHSFGSFRKNKKETKKEEREKELPSRETLTPDSSRGGKIMQVGWFLSFFFYLSISLNNAGWFIFLIVFISSFMCNCDVSLRNLSKPVTTAEEFKAVPFHIDSNCIIFIIFLFFLPSILPLCFPYQVCHHLPHTVYFHGLLMNSLSSLSLYTGGL